ncbi:MAG: CinA family nicotinamide mononucleotide deamidase-related protein [Acidobacteriota bacterium]
MKRAHTAFLIAVGDELVTGRQADTNGERLSRWLESLGCDVQSRLFVPDRAGAVENGVRAALAARVDVMILTGGLGPTADDITRDGLAAGVELELELDPKALETIEHRYRERGRTLASGAARQAFRPRGAEWISNPIGTAPGILLKSGRTIVIALPGVPRELNEMLDRDVLPLLRRSLAGSVAMKSTSLHVACLPEAEVDRRIRETALAARGVQVTHVAKPGDIEVLLTARGDSEEDAESALESAVSELGDKLGDHLYGAGSDSQVSVLRDLLLEHRWTLGCAESVSGGLLSKRITDLPGASSFFLGSLVAYVNSEKRLLLDVSAEQLENFGPISAEVAGAMADGVRRKLGVDVALATTGIAGPGGGSAEKPVGLTYLAIVWPGGRQITRHTFTGDRKQIRIWSVTTTLDQVRRALKGLPPHGEVIERQAGPTRE